MVLVTSNTETQRASAAVQARVDDGSWNQDGVSGHEEKTHSRQNVVTEMRT